MVIDDGLGISGCARGVIQRIGFPLIRGQIGTGVQGVQRLAGHRTLIDQSFVAFFTQQPALIVCGIVYVNDRRLTRHQHQRLFCHRPELLIDE